MSVFSNPSDPSIPTRGQDDTKDAVRVSAHSETAMNDLKPVNNTMKMPAVGKMGLKGDGQQK